MGFVLVCIVTGSRIPPGGQRSARVGEPLADTGGAGVVDLEGVDLGDTVGRLHSLREIMGALAGGGLAAATARESRQLLAAYREQFNVASKRPLLPVRHEIVRSHADALRFADGPIDVGDEYRIVPILRSTAKILEDRTTQKILVHGGVGSGKTLGAGVFKHLDLCIANAAGGDDLLNFFVAPDAGYLRDVVIRHFRTVLTWLGVWGKCTWFKRDMDLVVRGLGPEFTVCLRSAEASLAGRNLSHFTLDEAELVKEYVAEDLMERVREPRAKVRQAVFLCAPDGIGSWAHRWFVTDALPNTRTIRMSTRDNFFLPPDYIEKSLSHLTGAARERYIEGHFVASTGRVFDRYAPGIHDSIPAVYSLDAADDYVMGCDFGSGCSFFSLWARVGDVMLCFGEIVREDTDTFQMCDEAGRVWESFFASRGEYLGVYGAAGRVTCVIDPAGGKDMKTSVSDAAVLERAGYKVYGHARHRNVRDGVLAVNRKLMRDELFVDQARAPGVHRALLYQQYDKFGRPEKGQHKDKSRAVDHASDSVRYPIEYFFEIPRFDPHVVHHH